MYAPVFPNARYPTVTFLTPSSSLIVPRIILLLVVPNILEREAVPAFTFAYAFLILFLPTSSDISELIVASTLEKLIVGLSVDWSMTKSSLRRFTSLLYCHVVYEPVLPALSVVVIITLIVDSFVNAVVSKVSVGLKPESVPSLLGSAAVPTNTL